MSAEPVEITDQILSTDLTYKRVGTAVKMYRPVVLAEVPVGTWKVESPAFEFMHCGNGSGYGAGLFDPLRPCHIVRAVGTRYFICDAACGVKLHTTYPGAAITKIH